METYTLLIEGKDIDTKNYNYFPYSDKMITDFKTTRNIISELKGGKIPLNTNEYIYARYCKGDENLNRIALKSAYLAAKQFQKFPLGVRRRIFLKMYELLLKNKEEFIKLLIIEGHPRKLAEWEFEGMKIGSSPKTINFYVSQIREEIGKDRNEILYYARKPDGVVCISPPGNAAASNSYNAILVFLVGNALVIKPPMRMPISTIFLWKNIVYKALQYYNAPPGVLNIVLGNSQKIMNEWISSPYVNDIIFFGDSTKGLEIGVKIFNAGKKPILELSGNDLFCVWKDADIDRSTTSLLDAFLGSTQICMVPKIALIHEEIYNRFINKFIGKVKKIKVGLPSDPETILSPVTKIKDFFEFLEDAVKKGGEILYGGRRINHLGQIDNNGLYLQPTLVRINDGDMLFNMRFLKEEIFFPLLPLIKLSGNDKEIFSKMINIIDSHQYGLRVSLWANSPKYLRKFGKEVNNCGLFRINTRHVGFSYYLSTHGGTKKTGGPFGEMNYFWSKTSHLQGICRIKK